VFDQLADGVFRRHYESIDLNVGVVVGEDGLLIVDTRASHVEADQLRDELHTLTTLPVRWVVDTHWHWDHTFGNARFPEAEIWGHDMCRKAMIEQGDSMKEDAARWLPDRVDEFDEVIITPPTEVLTTTATIDMGSKKVALTYHGLGHTDGDIAITVDGHDVVFLGDLVEGGSPPVFGDAYPLSWPNTVRSALVGGATVVVPGHGDTMDRVAAFSQLEELEQVADLARRVLTEGLPVGEAVRLGPFPEPFMHEAMRRAVEVGP
jgi:glyoxylase-like metal-dependent hydrolase (beta-lactamase superfamily II)